MSMHDQDDHLNARPRGSHGGNAQQGDFRVDPSFSPRAGYSQGYQPSYQEPAEEYEDHYAEPPPRKRAVTSTVIVALGLGVFGGVIYYAYNQGMRAGSESVAPILRAETEPTKRKPDQPGGLDVPHQDKLVYDRLRGGGTPQEVERLLPPPEAPLERPRAEPELPPEQPVLAEAPPAGPPMPAPAAIEPATQAPPSAVAARPGVASGAPMPLAPTATQSTTLAAPPPAVQTAPAAAPAPTAVKPAAPAAAPPAQSQTAALPQPPKPAAQPPVAAAAVRLQVGAVDAEGKAAGEWSRLQRKFPGELGGLSMRTVRADLGAKGIFYRIQAGPVDEARARQICAALKAQSVGCLLVK